MVKQKAGANTKTMRTLRFPRYYVFSCRILAVLPGPPGLPLPGRQEPAGVRRGGRRGIPG